MAIINKSYFIFIIICLCNGQLSAQEYKWWTPAKQQEIRFRTNSEEIVVRCIDSPVLYSIDPHGAWKKQEGQYDKADTITCRFLSLPSNTGEYRLYLPESSWVQVGVPGQQPVHPLSARKEKPIVVYSQSDTIATYLDKLLDRQVLKLNATTITTDAKAFILDGTTNDIIQSAKAIRKKSPVTPIILTDIKLYKKLKHLHQVYLFETGLRNILHEPVGTINTTIPCRQYRELIRYDWDERHAEILAMKGAKTVLIGNSITHFWGGLPAAPIARGTDSWKRVMDPVGTINMGFGWDRIENVLWRVYHDELDGYTANKIYIMIGTNNLELNTDEEIITGLRLLVQAVKQRQPKAGILLSGILPRKEQEKRIVNINLGIMQMAGEEKVQFINPGKILLKEDATIDASLFTDGLHPNTTGYNRLADFLQPYLQ